jgi:poly-gamma-glutamate synthesis protein (capsule biosynthesis protein)
MGDVNLGFMLENYKKGVFKKIRKDGINPFAGVSDQLNKADINVINLECVLSDSSDKTLPFSEVMRVPTEVVKVLKENNIHVVNLANNHTMDHGPEAFREMKTALNQAGIKTIVDRNIFPEEECLIYKTKGISIGFPGYYIEETILPEEYDVLIAKIKEDLTLLSQKCDHIILSLHWGHEYTTNPMLWQINLAKELINSFDKLSVIHGHHPHRLHGIVKYKTGIIASSLGNFVFDEHLKINRITGILQVLIKDTDLTYNFTPCFINKNFQPEITQKYDPYLDKLNQQIHPFFSSDKLTDSAWDEKLLKQSIQGHQINRLKVRVLYLRNLLLNFKDLKPLLKH